MISKEEYIEIPRQHRTASWIKNHRPDIYDFFEKQFPQDLSWSEKNYWFLNDVKDYPKCPICGKRLNYSTAYTRYTSYCCKNCANKSQDRINKIKHTKKERYGDPNWNNFKQSQETCMINHGVRYPGQIEGMVERVKNIKEEKYGDSNYNNRTKAAETCLKEYGEKNPSKVKKFLNKIRQTKEERYGDPAYVNVPKMQKTDFDKFGCYYVETEEFKRLSRLTCLEKYKETSYSKTQEYKKRIKDHQSEINQKIYKTKKKNKSFNSSKIEQEFKQWLDKNKINYIYQYKSKEYPFVCDFYFPDQDLYFEIQGSWTHGKHPFDPNSIEDQKTIEEWKNKNSKFYDLAIDTWTRRDVLKRNVGKNLNWTEVFTIFINEVIESYEEARRYGMGHQSQHGQ